ncbi:MAG: hypothetical protein VR65_13640 [Desulfobulbaceae bacterium BRH_c16a]|nr:MAG: hypothetical protein VR65_13640 [Desulfobulbaceae bacterium BRH_c16a]
MKNLHFNLQIVSGFRFRIFLLSGRRTYPVGPVTHLLFVLVCIFPSITSPKFPQAVLHPKAPDHEPEIYRFLVEEGQTCL